MELHNRLDQVKAHQLKAIQKIHEALVKTGRKQCPFCERFVLPEELYEGLCNDCWTEENCGKDGAC